MSSSCSSRDFRSIRPASPQPRASATAPMSSRGGLPPKSRRAAQACYGCRKSRIKCDGQRPTCSPCAGKSQACGYEEGRSRHLATKSRLESLEKLVDALKTGSPDQASRLLGRIRTMGTLIGVMDEVSHSSSNSYSSGSEQNDTESSPSSSTFRRTSSSCDGPPEGVTPFVRMDVDRVQVPMVPEPIGATIPDPPSGTGTGKGTKDRSPELIRLLLPDAEITEKGVNTFYNSCGRLFHVFPREQIAECYHAAYKNQNGTGPSVKVDICFLMSVAAVGAQYLHEDFPTDMDGSFYDIARHCYETVVEKQPLDAIKVCALLALYNIMDKDTISLAYVETGLGMCRRYGLAGGDPRLSSLTDAQWVDYRKTWRTLMFFSSWLASTLGYISGNDLVCERLSLSDMISQNPSDLSEIVQTEMTKICLLKADMLRLHLTLKELTASDVQSILEDLQQWHRELPPVMRLSYAGREEFSVEARRSIFHVHLLYLGAIMLLYRRIASEVSLSYASASRSCSLLPPSLEDVVTRVAGEAVLAARISARILKLLLHERGVFKRCWIVIFQTYTSCLIMLHSAAQKQLHNFNPAALEDDIAGIRDALGVLSFCASSDRIATKFLQQLTDRFNQILTQQSATVCGGLLYGEGDMESHSVTSFSFLDEGLEGRDLGDFGYLLTIPKYGDASQTAFCLSLLEMIGRPFADPFSTPIPQALMQKTVRDVSVAPSEQQQGQQQPLMKESLEWNPESSVRYKWDTGLMSPGMAVPDDALDSFETHGLGPPGYEERFVGSTKPSGWADATQPRCW